MRIKRKSANYLIAGDPGADPDDGQTPETGGAQKAHAENAPTPETKAGGLQADPGGLTVHTSLWQS